MNKTTEALKLAEKLIGGLKWSEEADEALAAIREALAEQEKQEPVAYPNLQPVINWLENRCDPKEAAKELRIYQEQMKASPVSAKREWVDLTDDEIFKLGKEKKFPDTDPVYFGNAVIAAFKEKNK